MGDSLGISVTDETLERATRVKRLIGRPQESAHPERKSTHVMVMSPRFNRNKNSCRKSKAIPIILLYYVEKRRSSENHENFIV